MFSFQSKLPYSLWVLGTKLESSARAVCALNHWAILPVPTRALKDFGTIKKNLPTFIRPFIHSFKPMFPQPFLAQICTTSITICIYLFPSWVPERKLNMLTHPSLKQYCISGPVTHFLGFHTARETGRTAACGIFPGYNKGWLSVTLTTLSISINKCFHNLLLVQESENFVFPLVLSQGTC